MSSFTLGGEPQAEQKPAFIQDSSAETFAADVLEASRTQPVIVDFWAPWCGPCKQLTPIIEKMVTAAAGAVKLVKVNIDENPELAQGLRIQSVPTVYAFKNGQPVDGFAGALPESQVKAFVERLAGPVGPSPVEQILEEAEAALEGGDLSMAAQGFAAILQEEPANARAIAGLARCYLRSGDAERARQTLEMAPDEAKGDQAIAGAQAELDLAGAASDQSEIAALRAGLEQDPKNHQARFDLALALSGDGKHEDAMNELLELVRRDRHWNEDAARKQLLTIFEALGPTNELTVEGRRRLSTILFS